MARARNIKPGFYTNDGLAECDPLARILFTAMWCLSDREGRMAHRPKKIKVEALPYDECDIDDLINQLVSHGFIFIYAQEDVEIIQINNWSKHQNPHHKEVESEFLSYDQSIHKLIKHQALIKHDSSMDQAWIKHGSSMDQENLTQNALTQNALSPSYPQENCVNRVKTQSPKDNAMRNANKADNDECVSNNTLKNNENSMHGSSMDQAWIKQSASCPTDSLNLIPDSLNLIPDSLNLIPDSISPQNAQCDESETQNAKPTKSKRTANRFDEFWNLYDKKSDRKRCLEKWKSRNLDSLADTIIQSVKEKKAHDSQWANGYQPNPLTFINGDKWEDETNTRPIVQAKEKPKPVYTYSAPENRARQADFIDSSCEHVSNSPFDYLITQEQ